MATYVARIGTADGTVATRTIEAADEAAARSEVLRSGGRIFSIKSSKGEARAGAVFKLPSFLPGRRGVKLQEFIIFNQELVALLRAGLPIVSGFDILIERQANLRFKRILTEVREQLVSGVAMSDAFAAHGDEFPRLYATSLKAGERSGEVATVLKRFLAYQKILGSVKRKVTGALVYPAVLISLSVVLILILLTYVIPKFTEFYAGFDAGELPMLTKIVVGTANAMQNNFFIWSGAVVVGLFALSRFKKTEKGAVVWDALKLKLPLVGKILHQFALSQFTRALATLVGAGTPLVPALDISSGSIANRRIAAAVTSVVPKVREGAELWRSLENTGQFTSLAVEMIKVGEATGALEEMLENVAEFYDETIEAALQKLITLIEPVILIVMGGLIATILLSIYLPMFTILSHIKT
jgi:type IV pilus assembly protein PilC